MKIESIAWVPDDDETDWDTAAGLAAEWVEQRCDEEDAGAVLVTHTLGDTHQPTLERFARNHRHTSRLGDRDRAGSGIGPVLAFVPNEEDLHFAMRLARDSSLGVVEGHFFKLSGWAAWFEAWNLVANQPTAHLCESVKEAVDRLAFHGNNGFGDAYGKQNARHILDDLRGEGSLDGDVLLGAVLAAGVTPRGVKNLRRLLARS